MKRILLSVISCSAIALSWGLAPASASATVLCINPENPCKVGTWPTGTEIVGPLRTGVNSLFENGLGVVTCKQSQIKMTTVGPGGAGVPVPARVSEVSFAACTRAGETCSATAVNLGAKTEEQYLGFFVAEKPPKGNGTFELTGSNLGGFGVKIHCGTVIECTLSATPTMAVLGGIPPAIGVVVPMKTAGAKCPPLAPTWRAEWLLNGPLWFWLEAE